MLWRDGAVLLRVTWRRFEYPIAQKTLLFFSEKEFVRMFDRIERCLQGGLLLGW